MRSQEFVMSQYEFRVRDSGGRLTPLKTDLRKHLCGANLFTEFKKKKKRIY